MLGAAAEHGAKRGAEKHAQLAWGEYANADGRRQSLRGFHSAAVLVAFRVGNRAFTNEVSAMTAFEEELELDICDPGIDDEVPAVTGSEAAYLRFVEEARALPADQVIVCRANVALAYHNVKRGVDAVWEKRDVVAKLPGIEAKRIFELPELALGVAHAADLAARVGDKEPNKQYASLVSQGHGKRRLLLASLDACAEAGLVPKNEIAPIRRGSGPLDLVGDLATLVALFRKYGDVLKHKTPVMAKDIEEASEIETALRQLLKPKGTPVAKAASTPEQAVDDRDRLWTLLVRGHADLRRVGGFLFGAALSEKVPALQSRLRPPPKPAPEPA